MAQTAFPYANRCPQQGQEGRGKNNIKTQFQENKALVLGLGFLDLHLVFILLLPNGRKCVNIFSKTFRLRLLFGRFMNAG